MLDAEKIKKKLQKRRPYTAIDNIQGQDIDALIDIIVEEVNEELKWLVREANKQTY